MTVRGARLLLLGLALSLTCYGPVSAAEDGVVAPEGTPCTSVEIFHREGCPHCGRAMAFIADLRQRRPALSITEVEINQSREAMERFFSINRRFGIEHPGVPSFLICDRFLVGFDDALTTGAQIEALLGQAPGVTADTGTVDTRWFGTLDATQLGLPLFTVAIGLIDGINPCAMWVLLFLLSLLVNLRDRRRMLLIAGTFVLVSGAVYFAFMAAWLNLFLIIGFSRPLQLAVGALAVTIGFVHLKDFFAPGRGVSLSIPAAAKPGIYAHVRRVIYAQNTGAALLAVTVVAVMVNMIELLCTAGLPAVYTQILMGRQLDPVAYYGYLLLYNLAYVFDDALMVGIVVYTMSRHKLDQRQGRWLKLLSGATVVLLGLLLLFAPQWLI